MIDKYIVGLTTWYFPEVIEYFLKFLPNGNPNKTSNPSITSQTDTFESIMNFVLL